MEKPAGSMSPRLTWEDYPAWLVAKSSQADVTNARTRLEFVAQKIRSEIEGSEFWQRLIGSLNEMNDEYTSLNQYKLFISLDPPPMNLKSYESLLDKSYRKNVLLNVHWPEAPDGGWITPINWYDRMNDIIRTTVVVKYLDGVQFFVDRIRKLADGFGHNFSVDYEAREEGYYAAHCYIAFKINIPTLTWETETTSIRFEIQVTTQLQDVIRNLTHEYYERRRSRRFAPDVKWQWDYSCSEFVPNYLGHMLHYIEGMIMQVRMRGEDG